MNEKEVRDMIDLRAQWLRTRPPRIKLEVKPDPQLEALLDRMEAAILILRETTKEIALYGGAMLIGAEIPDGDPEADHNNTGR